MRPRWLLVLVLVLAGCGRGVGQEALGDVAAASGRWGEALEAWQDAGDEPRILAKRADAALNAGRLNAAAVEFVRLGRRDSSRTGEAAAGLARTAMAAARVDDRLALAAAINGLAEVAPGWPMGRLTLSLRLASFPAREDILRLAPAVLAAAPARDQADSVLLAWARAEHEDGDCLTASGLYGTVERRGDAALARPAGQGIAACGLLTGLSALAGEQMDAARLAFEAAVQRDPDGDAGRRALVGLGDVHFQTGDLFQAQLAWRTAASTGTLTDSITTLALERLRASEVVDSAGEFGTP
jgi:tetratricopeptide (TPR) repeat protein